MCDKFDVAEIERLLEAATPGDWQWVIEDHSMAMLGVGDNIGLGGPHVLSLWPCNACAKRADPKEWEWGRCVTPSEADARLIAAAPAAIRSLLSRTRALEAALRWYAGEAENGERFYIVDEKGERLARFSEYGDRARAALKDPS